MEEIERPEKRRKLDCEKDDGNQASRSPRVVLNKINVDNALLERFRKIKRLARQKLGAKLEKKGNANERIDAGEKQKTSLELLKAADGSTNSNNEINLLEDNESTGCLEKREGISLFLADKLNADETVEVIDSSETWICKNNLSQKSAKRKRDENCNESTSFGKVTKFLESTSVSIDEGKQLGPLSGTNETAFSLSKSDEGSEKGSSSDQFDKDFEVGGTSENHQNNVVKVTKVAQDYAKSGAQTEKVNSDDMETAESGNLSGENTDNKNIFEGEEHAEESLVYQLLKDVIEKQTSVFANDLVLENAKLEKRVDHLEKENALLQRTSKRLHLALKAVFKNREKAKVPRSSCGVQVNIDLNQPSFSLTPVVNIDIPDERNSKEKPFEKMENSSSFSAINESSLTSSQKNRIPTGEDSAQSSLEQEKSGGEPKMVEVTMTTIGTQTQEHTPKYFTEGMGHFKLQCLRHRGKPSIVDSGEKSHYKMTPHGLQLKTKWSASSKNHEEESRTEVIDTSCTQTKDLSKSPIRGTFSLRKNISTDQNCTMSDKEKRTSPFSENLRRNEEHAANTDVADHPRAKHMSTSTARSNESLRTHLKTSQKSQNESLVAREHEQEASYRDPQSPVIPKHSISTAIKTVNLPRDQSSKGKEEPDLIIVSSNEPSPPRMAMPSLRSNNESSFRAVQNEVKSKTKEREMIERREREMLEQKKREIMERKEREMLERKEREVLARQEKEMLERQRPVYYSQSIRQQKRNEMLVERIMSENTIPKSTPVTLDNLNPNSQEMRKSNAVHMSQIQSQQTLQYTNAVMRAREQSAQPITAQGAPRPQRYGAPEMMVVSQTEGRENGSAPRGSSLPPQLIPSQPQRVQEQLRPPRSISFETAETQRNQGQTISGIAQVNNAIHLQRAQVAAQSNRSQQPLQQTHLSQQQQQQQQQQQHLIARQQHLQQIATPGYQQPRAGNLQGLTQQHPRASQPNISRQQAPPPYQSPHRLQQIPRPMVDPGRSHANMPLSPEFGRTFIQRAPYKDAPPHLIPGNVQQTRQGPVVVYQPGALEGGVRPAAPTSQAQFERLQDQMRQAQNPPQGQISQPPQRVTNAVVQLPPSIQSQRTTSCEMQQVNDRRARVVPERPQQTHVNTSSSQRSPPKPSASIAIVENGIVLSWNVSPEQDTSDIDSFELFACQDDSNSSCPPVLWKKIGVVKALPLPMACTLTQFSNGSRYQFAVRAVDSSERAGPFSDPCVILLKKS